MQLNCYKIAKLTSDFNIIFMVSTGTPTDFIPIAIMFLVALGFVAFVIVATHYLGPKRKTKVNIQTKQKYINITK